MKEEAYREAYALLEKSPLRYESEEAIVLMTNALFLSTVQDAPALDVVQQQLEKTPNEQQTLLQHCSHQMMLSRFPEAMEILLQMIRLDRDWHNGIASLCLRGLFIMLGKDNPEVIKYRQKLIDQQG